MKGFFVPFISIHSCVIIHCRDFQPLRHFLELELTYHFQNKTLHAMTIIYFLLGLFLFYLMYLSIKWFEKI